MARMSENGEILTTDAPQAMSWLFVGIVCGLTAILCLLVALVVVNLGVVGEWVWPYAKDAQWDRVWAPGCYFAILAGVVWVVLTKRDLTRLETGVALAMLVGLAFGLQLATAQLGAGGFHEGAFVTLSPWTAGYHSEALKAQDLRQYLAIYPDTIRAMSVTKYLAHVSNHPPGYIVFYWLLDRIAAASPSLTEAALRTADYLGPAGADVAGELGIKLTRSQEAGVWFSCLALRLIVCLTIIPVYLLAHASKRPAQAGIMAAAFAALVPAFHLFSPYPDAIIIFLAPWVIYFWNKALERRPVLFGILAGAAFFAATFCSLAVVVLGPMGAMMIVMRWLHPEGRQRLLRNVATAAAAGAGAYVALIFILWLATGCNLPKVFLVCFEKHSEFYASVSRTYWKWLAWNPGDFVLFLGIPAALVATRRMFAAAQCAKGTRLARLSDDRILFSAAIPLIILNLLGLNRGEAGRLWLVFMPFFCVGAGWAPDRRGVKTSLLLAAQFAQVCVLKLSLDVFGLWTK